VIYFPRAALARLMMKKPDVGPPLRQGAMIAGRDGQTSRKVMTGRASVLSAASEVRVAARHKPIAACGAETTSALSFARHTHTRLDSRGQIFRRPRKTKARHEK